MIVQQLTLTHGLLKMMAAELSDEEAARSSSSRKPLT